MSHKDEFGTRMKFYESVETGRRFDVTLPIYARLDGRSFSKFTKNMERPYDNKMSQSMIETTSILVDKTQASIGYTSSDEISLAWLNGVWFDYKITKMTSVLAGLCTSAFLRSIINNFQEDISIKLIKMLPHFDCRVIQMPNQTEVANMFLWRELDAQKNAISMAARHYFSHKSLHGKTGPEMIAMMATKGIDMNNFPVSFRRGTWVRRVTEEKYLTEAELIKIPDKYKSTIDINTPVMRTSVKVISMPPFISVMNREEAIFKNDL